MQGHAALVHQPLDTQDGVGEEPSASNSSHQPRSACAGSLPIPGCMAPTQGPFPYLAAGRTTCTCINTYPRATIRILQVQSAPHLAAALPRLDQPSDARLVTRVGRARHVCMRGRVCVCAGARLGRHGGHHGRGAVAQVPSWPRRACEEQREVRESNILGWAQVERRRVGGLKHGCMRSRGPKVAAAPRRALVALPQEPAYSFLQLPPGNVSCTACTAVVPALTHLHVARLPRLGPRDQGLVVAAATASRVRLHMQDLQEEVVCGHGW
jgi:hypothetical protein